MSFLFVDRITYSSPGELIRGVKHVTRDDPYLTVDAQGKPCFIPSLMGETLGQLAAWNVMQFNQFTQRPVAGVVDCTRLYRPAYVGETLHLESFIDVLDDQAVQYHSTASIDGEPVFIIDSALGPLLPMDDFIDSNTVQQQFAEIYRPGEWLPAANTATDLVSKTLDFSHLGSQTPMMFDSIQSVVPGQQMVAIKKISRAAPYFADHFPRKPVLPMTVLLECKLNLAKEFIAAAGFADDYQVSELRKVKMNVFVQPGDVIICTVSVKQHSDKELILSYRSEVEGKRVCVVDVVLIPIRSSHE